MYTDIHQFKNSIFKRILFTALFLNVCLLATAQLNSTSSQTISTSQTYTGASLISNSSTVTISAGTTTFNGTLTVGNSTAGILIVKSGATVIVNGTMAIGTSSNGSVIIENGGKLIVNPGNSAGTTAIAINSSATSALDVQTGGSVVINRATPTTNVALGLVINNSSKATVSGSLQIRGGGLSMNGTSKLTYSGSGNNDTIIGDPNAVGAYFSNNTILTVGSGVNLYIKGDVKNDSYAEFAIDGNVSINGNYQSGNNTANVTGTGTLNTTGSLDADSYQGSVFGQRYSCASGPCAGSNLISSSNTTTCNGGTVDITGVAISGATYQWLVSTTSSTSGFTSISGATAQNYSTTGSSSVQYTYYKRRYTLSGNTYNSNTLTITSSYWVAAPTVSTITGANSVCAGSTITLANATSGGTWSSAAPSVASIISSGIVTGVSAGSATISYTVTSSGCSGSATKTITVIGIPTPTTISSTGTYTVQAGTKAVLIQVWGAGGGGSKGFSNLKGTGGGGGGYAQKTMNVSAGNVLSTTIGAGGIGATTSGNGSAGGSTSVTFGSVVASATGGTGGQSTSVPSGTGGTGGDFSVGDFGFIGGSGATIQQPNDASPGGGAGGSAGTASNGNGAGNTNPGSGSSGGTAVTGGGAGGSGGSSNATGDIGSLPGGGGGGNAGTGNGGAGGAGRIIITAYYTSITYSSSSFCKTVTSAIPVIDGATGGAFSAPSGLTINSSTGDINPSTSTAGNYTVSYSNSCGVISTTFVKIVAVPTATAGGTATICQTGTATVSGATSSNGTIAWTENGAGSITSGAATLTPVYTALAADGGTTVTLTMTVSNSSCTSATATYSVVVNAIPTSVSGGSQTICRTGTATVSGATSTNGTINWTENGAGSISSGGSTLTPVYTPGSGDAGNTVTLTMTVSNSPCTAATSTYSVSVVAAPTASAGGSQTICQTNTATVSGAASSNGTIAWTENGAGSITSGASTLTPVYTSIAADGGNTVTLTMTVTSSPCANATATYSVIVSTCVRTWTGTTSTAWNTAGNWSPSTTPTSTDDVTIPSSAVRMPSVTSTSNTKSVTNNGTITVSTGTLNAYGNITNNGTLSISNASGTLNSYANITNNGTVTTVTGSTVAFNGASAQTITGVPVLYNVVINNTSGGVSFGSAVTVKGTLSLTKGILTTNSNLTINFDNGGNIAYASTDLGSISGNVSGRRDAVAKTHYIAAPFSGVTSAQVQATTPLFVNPYWKMYTKTFAAQNWAAVTNTTTAMPLGAGYSLSLPAAAPLIFTGTYDHTYTLTGPSYSNADAGKYFMVGNPYPSTIDWGTTSTAPGWTKTNVANAIYYWDAANSRSASYVAGVGTNGATRYIPAMQSFMVATTGINGPTSSVSMDNNVRLSSQTPSYFRVASVDDIIRLTLTGSDTTYRDEAVIRFNEMATDSFDFDLDAHKILNTGFMPSVYTKSKEEMYSINSFSSVDSVEYIPVAAKIVSDGAYTLKIAGNNSNIEYVLVDKLLGIKRSIESDSVYTFSGSKTDDVNRFELQLRTAAVAIPTGVQSANKNGGLGIYSSTKGFVIKTDRYAGEEAEIEILDMTGNSIKVISGKNLSVGTTYIPVDLSDGSYLVKVNVEGNTFAGMIVLVK